MENRNEIDRKVSKQNILPYLSNIPSEFKITTNSGHVFYAHNVKSEYRYDERMSVISNAKNYFTSINRPTPEQDAYFVLLWHLFNDYLNAYNFYWLRGNKKKSKKPKDLYILRNSQGFIKIGISSNVKARLVDLRYEWGGEFKIIKVIKNGQHLEKILHQKLIDFIFPIKHRHTKQFSSECFIDCKEVNEILSELVVTCQNGEE